MNQSIYNETNSLEVDVPVTFFISTCYYCIAPDTKAQPLKRCGGCQLVAYCSIECQKNHRYKHKYVCKEFPVIDGKNALHTTGPWEKHLAGLKERVARLPRLVGSRLHEVIFYNPRVCHTCHEAHPERLKDCKCASVSYCSNKCSKKDKSHKESCELLGQIGSSYSYQYDNQDDRDRLMNYSMTLYFALDSLGKRRLGRDQLRLEDLTTLDVHVIANTPLFYQEPWDLFMHKLPKLMKLNIVFIMQGSALKPSIKPNYNLSGLSLMRCKDCEAKDRVVTYSVQPMLYHMFFSSLNYTVPDVVVVYGNSQVMLADGKDDINNKISYSNMTYNRDTILVLTDATDDLMKQGVKAVNAAQPVNQLLGPPKINKIRGFGSGEVDLNYDIYYFTCLRRAENI